MLLDDGKVMAEEAATEYQVAFAEEFLVRNWSTKAWAFAESTIMTFTANGGLEEFKVNVYPNGRNGSTPAGSVAVELWLTTSALPSIRVSLIFSIVKRDRTSMSKQWLVGMLSNSSPSVCNNMISYQYTANAANEVLHEGDTLVVKVQCSYPSKSQQSIIKSETTHPVDDLSIIPVNVTYTWTLCNVTHYLPLTEGRDFLSEAFPVTSRLAKFRLILKADEKSNDYPKLVSYLDRSHPGVIKPRTFMHTFELIDRLEGGWQHVRYSCSSIMPGFPIVGHYVGVTACFKYRDIIDTMVNQCVSFRYRISYGYE